MANQITSDISMRIDNDDISFTKRQSNVVTEQVEGTRYSSSSADVTTSVSNLDIGSQITIAGLSMFINHSTDNNITITSNVVLKPGEVALFRPDSTTISVSSNVSTARLEWLINED